MKTIPHVYFEKFVAAARLVAEQGLVIGSSGNLSFRVNDGLMLLTANGSRMGSLSPDDIAVCRINDSVILNGKKPSKEIGFHAGILRDRIDVNAVLHFQAPWATTIACSSAQVRDFSVIPEIPYYIGPVATVPYLAPGSDQLAKAVVSAVKGHDLVLLLNHGQVVVGEDIDGVIEKAAYFELACQIIIGAGKKVQFIPGDTVYKQRRKGKPGGI